MSKKERFENYPAWIVIVFNLASWSVHVAGLYILYLLWPVLTLPFLLYILYLEFSVYRGGCVNCYYYGKVCASGRGKLAKLLFKKDDPKKFCLRSVGWKDFIPGFLGSVVTIVVGIYLLVQSFSWIVLIATAWPIVIFMGNQYTYGELACPNCKQAELCCPVSEFFMKKEKK